MDLAIGAFLTPTFTFLFGRLAHVLDHRRSRDPQPEVLSPVPDVLQGQLRPLVIRDDVLAERIAEFKSLWADLNVYERHPEQLSADDADLRALLERTRTLLEDVYGQRLTFRGEDREDTGIAVDMRVRTISGSVTGAKVRDMPTSARVRQDVDTVAEGGSLVGFIQDGAPTE